MRVREVYDGAAPAANPLAGLALLELAERTGEERFAAAAAGIVRSFAGQLARAPEGTSTLALLARRLARGGGRPAAA